MDVSEINIRLETIKALVYELMEDIDASGGLFSDEGELAQAAYDFHGLKAMVDESYSLFSSTVINALEYTPVPIELPDGGSVEIKSGSARKSWDHDAIGSMISSRIVDSAYDPDTGERLLEPDQMVKELLKYAGISYWRVKPSAELGVNVNQYCEVQPPKTNLIVRRGNND